MPNRYYSVKVASLLLALGFSVLSLDARAQSFHSDLYQDIRWLSRGNTGVASINDGTALFYNPAGLGMQDVYQVQLINPYGGTNWDNLGSILGLASLGSSASGSISAKFAPFLGKNVGLPMGLFPNFSLPHFAMGFIDTFKMSFQYKNPVDPELHFDLTHDYGVILGTGFGYQSYINFGISFLYLRREQIFETLTPMWILSNATAGMTALQALRQKGDGFGVNLGVMSKIPLGPFSASFGAAVEQLGFMKFRTAGMPTQAQKVNIGTTIAFNTALIDGTFLLDGRDILNSDIHQTKMIFSGIELNLLGMDMKAGIYQGYWTAGMTMRWLPIFDIQLASYAEELGYAAGIRESRVYLMSLSMNIGLKAGGRGAGKKSGKRYRSQLDAL